MVFCVAGGVEGLDFEGCVGRFIVATLTVDFDAEFLSVGDFVDCFLGECAVWVVVVALVFVDLHGGTVFLYVWDSHDVVVVPVG